MNGLKSCVKKVLVSLCLILICGFSYAADTWVLGARKFEFSNKNIERTSSEKSKAELLPKLILEQIASEITRYSPEEEILERKLQSLTTERLSLFLQLSKEIKVRDNIVVSTKDSKKLSKKVSEQNVKIKEIQDKIDENLVKTEKLKNSLASKTIENSESSETAESILKNDILKKFTSLFTKTDDAEKITGQEETVKLYKDSESSLFDAGSAIYNTPEFDKAVIAAKINGLISGEITTYGSYASVSCSLVVYPGRIEQGIVTEAGSLDDLISLASNIARRIVPLITNNLPIEVYFSVQPEECMKTARLSVDGVVYNGVPEKLIFNSGVHKLQLECEGYLSKSFSYNFYKSNRFMVTAMLQEENISEINFNILNPANGKFYANGEYAGSAGPGVVGTKITVNGQDVLGQFISDEHSVKKVKKEVKDENGKTKKVTEEEEGPNLTFFYYIPGSLQDSEKLYAVNSVAQDNNKVIDKRRIWTYRGYSALVLTLPFTLYTTGQSLNVSRAYEAGYITDVSKVNLWTGLKYGGLALTGAATGFFVYEIVQYLRAANAVLPKTVKTVSEADLLKAVEKSNKLSVENNEKVSENVDSEKTDEEALENKIEEKKDSESTEDRKDSASENPVKEENKK